VAYLPIATRRRLTGQYDAVRRRRAPLGTLVAAAIVAGSCGADRESLAAYAAGEWTCGLEVVDEPDLEIPSPYVSATVTAFTDTSGRVEFTFPWLALLSVEEVDDFEIDLYEGEWRLEDGELSVKWDDESLGTVDADPISLDSERFKIRGGTAEEDPQWVDVEVERDGDTVTFEWEDEFEQSDVRLHCEKA